MFLLMKPLTCQGNVSSVELLEIGIQVRIAKRNKILNVACGP